MKKSGRKLRLNVESLYRLDSLAEAAGGYAYTHTCSVNYTCPLSACGCPPPSKTCFC
jgi:hypothetical protein